MVIPKSIFPNELEANMDIEGWELTPEQCKDIGKLGEREKGQWQII